MDVVDSFSLMGAFFDAQLNGDSFITWDMKGDVKCYPFSKIVHSVTEQARTAVSPKYFEKHVVWTSKTVGGIFPTDTVVMGGIVYTASETGFYEGMRIKRTGKNYLEGREDRIWDGIPTSLRRGYYNRVTISAGEDGLFEYEKSILKREGDLKEVEKNLYCISDEHSFESRYLRNTIMSRDEYDDVRFSVFYNDIKHGIRRKEKSYELKKVIEDKIEVVTTIGSKDEFFKREMNKIVRYTISKNSKCVSASVFKNKVGRDYRTVHHYAPFGIISESDNYFRIRFFNKGQTEYLSKQGVVRWRLFRNVNATKFCLIIVFENRIHVMLIQ